MSQEKRNIKQAFIRYIKGYYTKNDADLLIRELSSEIISGGIDEEMDRMWEDSAKIKPTSSKQQEYEKEAKQLLRQIKGRPDTHYLKPFFKYVAAASIILIAGATFYFLIKNKTADISDVPLITLEIENGTQKQITLADGTQVVLNAGSSFSYPEKFEGEERKVFLDGEAFFNVSPNKGKPFIVQTSDAKVKVLGTSFNINAYEESDGLAVTVESGKVQVELAKASLQLSASEHLNYNRTSSDFSKSTENVSNTKLWISGGMYFNRTPIKEVVQVLMRKFDCSIEFADGEDNYEEYIYGMHDGEDLETILNAISFTTGIKHKKSGDKIILYKKGK
ncbi:MAG: FecR domain-containing protein [Prevotella sp.]|jgi:ferric-dicitrate binding protein FerR (iron transport regulator)|nr:FecR domain-containing protein [Prevotella sp.]